MHPNILNYVFFLKTKDEAFEKFNNYKAEVENIFLT